MRAIYAKRGRIRPLLWMGGVIWGAVVSQTVKAEGIPVVGLDRNHHEVGVTVSEESFRSSYSHVLSAVHGATLPALPQDVPGAAKSKWMLRDVVIGIGLEVSAGLSHLYSMTAAPRVRMVFSNSTHPKFPD